MRANADKRGQTQRRKRRGENASKRKQTQANASKRGQTQTNAYIPLYCGFLHPPLQSPYFLGPLGDWLPDGHAKRWVEKFVPSLESLFSLGFEPIFGKGMRRSSFQWKKGIFSAKGGGNSVNQGLGKDLYRKGNSVKRFGPFTEPPDSENWKVAVLLPFPKISSYWASREGVWDVPGIIRKRAEYCFESTVSEKRTPSASLSFGANSVSSAKNSVSSRLHTKNRLKGTHWVRSPELSEPRKTHWVRCLKPYSPKPYSPRFRIIRALFKG